MDFSDKGFLDSIFQNYQNYMVEYLKEMSENETLVKQISEIRDEMLGAAGYIQKIIEQQLKTLNIPTKEPFLKMLFKMNMMEVKLNEVLEKLEKYQGKKK